MFWGFLVSVVVVTNFDVAVAVAVVAVYCGGLLWCFVVFVVIPTCLDPCRTRTKKIRFSLVWYGNVLLYGMHTDRETDISHTVHCWVSSSRSSQPLLPVITQSLEHLAHCNVPHLVTHNL